MVAVMQLFRGVINAVTVMIAVIVMVAVSSGFLKSTHIGPYRALFRVPYRDHLWRGPRLCAL